MTVDFKELVQKNVYEIAQVDVDSLKNAFAFENVDKTQIKQIQSRQKLSDFKLINLSFLNSRNENGYPKFAVFSMGHSDCRFQGKIDIYRRGTNISVSTNFQSKCLRTQYTDICRDLLAKAVKGKRLSIGTEIRFSLTSKFTGILPQESRDEIKRCEKQFDEIVVIAESENWTYNETVTYTPPNPDPLIVGIKDNLAYVIGTFDMTKLENYIVREFTEG